MTIQYIMLVSLGFLIASLIALLLAPIFWQRAVRLTSTRLRQSLPLTEQEILADKDQLRAKYAIRVHQLEKQVEQASLGGARQKIDLNRRDASIAQLETDLGKLKAELEESQNARGVLEQTVGDRIPKIEARLEEARKLLLIRDREVAELSQSSRRQQDALNDAKVINKKQGAENERLRSQMAAYEAQSRRDGKGIDVEGDLAIRAELEQLRSRTQDQASMIERLTSEIASVRSKKDAGSSAMAAVVPLNGSARDAAEEIETLRRDVAILEAQLELAQAGAATLDASAPATDGDAQRELRAITAKAQDQESEIARLNSEMAALTAAKASGEGETPSLLDNRIALKARLNGLEAKSSQQAEIIRRLRAELAQANERAARQAATFVDEMRRLGIAAHITQPRTGRPTDTDKVRSVARRTQAVFEAAHGQAGGGSPQTASIADDAHPAGSPPPTDLQPAPLPLARRLAGSGRKADRSEAAGSAEAAVVSTTGEDLVSQQGRVGHLVAALRGSAGTGQGGVAGAPLAVAPARTNVELQGMASNSNAVPASDAAGARQQRLLDRIAAADRKS